MKILHTIEEAHKIFDTQGSSPLLVTCGDFQDWVCKYDKHSYRLFKELIASKFAEIWNINTPETAFIKVKAEHIPANKFPKLQLNWFEKECFGSLYLHNSKEIDHSVVPMLKDNVSKQEDFLKIALFDIWLANEDRNHNNFNLLLYPSPEKLKLFYAIDHVNIFNSGILDYEIAELTEDDSIIKTDLAKILFGKNKNLNQIMNEVIENFYLCTEECCSQLDEILDLVPESWNINKVLIKERMVQNLFTLKWKQQCEFNFREFVQSFIVN